jgi:hypothetical protein
MNVILSFVEIVLAILPSITKTTREEKSLVADETESAFCKYPIIRSLQNAHLNSRRQDMSKFFDTSYRNCPLAIFSCNAAFFLVISGVNLPKSCTISCLSTTCWKRAPSLSSIEQKLVIFWFLSIKQVSILKLS